MIVLRTHNTLQNVFNQRPRASKLEVIRDMLEMIDDT